MFENSVYIVWHDFTSGNGEILYRRSIDGGVTFEGTINLSNDARDSLEPAIAASGDNVYVVWRDEFQPISLTIEIFYKRSADCGTSFGATENLSNNGGDSAFPDIAAFDNNVYVVWYDSSFGNTEILYRRSIDSGANFDDIINLSSNPGFSGSPAISALENNAYVVWQTKIV